MSASAVVVERPLTSPDKQASLARRFAGNFLVRRLVKALVTIWLVISATFFLIHLMPGNPIEAYIEAQMGQFGLSYSAAKAQAAALFSIDLNRPLPLQYL